MPPSINSSPKEDFTAEELALLSEEERAHINDDLGDNVDDDPEAIAAANAAAKEIEDNTAADKKAEEDAAAAVKAAADKADAEAEAARKAEELAEQQKLADAGDEVAKKAIADQAAAKKVEDDAAAKVAEDAAALEAAKKPVLKPRDGVIERTPVMVESLIEELHTGLEEKLGEIAKKFDDGDLTAVEMRDAENLLRKDIRAKERELTKELAVVAVSSREWGEKTVPEWLAAHPEYRADPDLMKALDKEVRDQQGATKRQYDPTFLEEAHKKLAPKVDAVRLKITADEEATVRKVLGLGPNDPLPKKAAATKLDVKDPKQRKMPPNLGSLPAADITDVTDGGKYAALDRLSSKDPIAYEAAFAKMTKADQDAYLAQ